MIILLKIKIIMGIKSTYYIDRETAIRVILSKVYDCTNEQLSDMLEDFPESYFRNYMVFDNLPEDDESWRNIRSVHDFSSGI